MDRLMEDAVDRSSRQRRAAQLLGGAGSAVCKLDGTTSEVQLVAPGASGGR